jgi:hypothetical protein
MTPFSMPAPTTGPTPATDVLVVDAPFDAGVVIISGQVPDTFEAEAKVAVAPDGTVAAAWIFAFGGGASSHIQWIFSPDAGVTWEHVGEIATPDGVFGADPDVTVDANGNFYLSWLAVTASATESPTRLMVARSPAGMRQFQPSVEASDPALSTNYDHPKITVTPQGTVLVTVLQIDPGTNGSGVVAWSSDGTTWQRSTFQPADSGRGSNFFLPCAPRTSGTRVYMTYFSTTLLGDEVDLIFSDDQGMTWSTPLVINDRADVPPSASDPACVTAGNDVWISYAVSTLTPGTSAKNLDLETGIRVAHSGDQGVSIDSRIDATDPAAGSFALLPHLALEDSGALDLIYYAGQRSPDPMGSLRWSRAAAGATGFASSVPVETLTFTSDRASNIWLGDYVGLGFHPGAMFAVFADNASGVSRIAFARLPVP